MAGGAGVRNFVLLREGGRNEFEGVAADEIVRQGLFDLGHVAGQTIVACALILVMGVCFERGGVRAVRRIGAVAFQAHPAAGLDEVGIVFGAVSIVAGVAGDASAVHEALHKIIALHAVLVAGAIREMREGGLAELVVFELPIIGKVVADNKADGPIERLAGRWFGERTAL